MLYVIGVLFHLGVQTRIVNVIGQSTVHDCQKYILTENGNNDFKSANGKDHTVFTCVTTQQFTNIMNGTLNVDDRGSIYQGTKL